MKLNKKTRGLRLIHVDFLVCYRIQNIFMKQDCDCDSCLLCVGVRESDGPEGDVEDEEHQYIQNLSKSINPAKVSCFSNSLSTSDSELLSTCKPSPNPAPSPDYLQRDLFYHSHHHHPSSGGG